MKKLLLLLTIFSIPYFACTPGSKVTQLKQKHGKVNERIAELQARDAFHDSSMLNLATPTAANKSGHLIKEKLAYDIIETADTKEMILEKRPAAMKLSVPIDGSMVTLLLYRPDSTAPPTVLKTNQGILPAFEKILTYRGTVQGVDSSLVTLTVSSTGGIAGPVSIGSKNYYIGKIKDDVSGNEAMYRDTTVIPFNCDARTIRGRLPNQYRAAMEDADATNKCTNIYWECDYDLYLNKGSNLAAESQFINEVFAQVQTLYANDGITINLKSAFFWTSTDPYIGPSTFDYLDQFGTYVEQHPGRLDGDLGMLIGTQGNGGVAWINGLCAGAPRYQVGYAGIFGSYNTLPSYSWTVEVLTHEMGHLFGSSHTHDCYQWAGGVRIDSCGDYAHYGSCQPPPPQPIRLPQGGGTIMSYCHLTSVGINFTKGFGPQPSAVIRNNIAASACLQTCGPPPPNNPPSVYCGGPFQDTLPQNASTTSIIITINLDDDISDIGHETLECTKKFGPSSTTIQVINYRTVNISGLIQGSYIFTFKETDPGGLSGSCDAVVNVVAAPPPPPPGQVFTDNFNRTSIDNGWTTAKGAWLITTNELNNAASTALQENILLQPTFYDTAQAAFAGVDMNTGPRFGIVLCYQSPGNYYLIYRNTGGSAQLRISKFVNGVETILKTKNVGNPAKCTLPTTNCFFTLRGRKVAGVLYLDLNGANQASVADNTYSNGQTGIYISAKGVKHRIDNFSAQ